MVEDVLDSSVGDFIDVLAQEEAPGGGSAAAVTVAMAAGLVVMVARASKDHWPEAGGAIGQAETFRARVGLRERREEDSERYRDQTLRDALEKSAEIPVRIVEAGADLACLAALLVENGNQEVRADAVVACLLAEGGARAAATLVETNLGATQDDARVRHVKSLVEVAGDAAKRALASAE